MKRVTSLDWLPIEFAKRDCLPGSEQIVLLYKPNQCYPIYVISNPDYAATNAELHGYTEFAILVDCVGD